MRYALSIAISAMALTGCAGNKQGARELLDALPQYSSSGNLVVGGYNLIDCPYNSMGTQFQAQTREGKPVRGSVCEGTFGQKTLTFR